MQNAIEAYEIPPVLFFSASADGASIGGICILCQCLARHTFFAAFLSGDKNGGSDIEVHPRMRDLPADPGEARCNNPSHNRPESLWEDHETLQKWRDC